MRQRENSLPDRVGLAGLPGALFVLRLLLSLFVAYDPLIRSMGRFGPRLRHPLLAAVFTALILHAFQIVFLLASQSDLIPGRAGSDPFAHFQDGQCGPRPPGSPGHAG
jgi:hypothetical protein